MSLRELAKKAIADRTKNYDNMSDQKKWEMQEELILLHMETEGLRASIKDLSYENELLQSQNAQLESWIHDLKLNMKSYQR